MISSSGLTTIGMVRDTIIKSIIYYPEGNEQAYQIY
jgi:hypothetical protein